MRNTLKMLSVSLLMTLVLSCNKASEAPRLKVLSSDGTPLTTALSLPFHGGEFTLTAFCEEEIDIFYEQSSQTPQEWFQLQEVNKVSAEEYRIKFTCEPLAGTLDLRNGTLSFVSPKTFIGMFLDIRQGYEQIFTENFSSLADKELKLSSGESWQSGLLTGLSSIKDAWVTFQAKAESANTLEHPVTVEIIGGASFPDIARTQCVVDIISSETYSNDNFYKLHIYNAGKVFSSETKLAFSVASDTDATIHIDNLTIYEIPVAKDGIIGGEDDVYEE